MSVSTLAADTQASRRRSTHGGGGNWMMRLAAKQFYYVMPQRFIFDFVPNSVSRLTRSDGTRASIEVMPIGQRRTEVNWAQQVLRLCFVCFSVAYEEKRCSSGTLFVKGQCLHYYEREIWRWRIVGDG